MCSRWRPRALPPYPAGNVAPVHDATVGIFLHLARMPPRVPACRHKDVEIPPVTWRQRTDATPNLQDPSGGKSRESAVVAYPFCAAGCPSTIGTHRALTPQQVRGRACPRTHSANGPTCRQAAMPEFSPGSVAAPRWRSRPLRLRPGLAGLVVAFS